MKEPVLNRRQAVALSAAAAATGFAGLAHADDAPMRLEVSFPPGGSTDIASRIIQPRLSELAGRPVIVENRPGAGGSMGVVEMLKTKPDGYKLTLTPVGIFRQPYLQKTPYDPIRDVTYIASFAT